MGLVRLGQQEEGNNAQELGSPVRDGNFATQELKDSVAFST